MFKITGLSEVSQELETAQKAIAALDGELGTVSFDPNDPSSIEVAIQGMERLIDERLGKYASNTLIGPLTEEMKASYRQSILDKAAEARLGRDDIDGE